MKRKQFEEYKRSGTANNITVGVLAVLGLICGAKSFTGTQITLVEYCFKPNNSPKFCTDGKRYVMPELEFNAEKFSPSNPEFQREGNFLPAKATRLRTIPPSNPNKPIWGLAATVLMGGAYGLSKARERRLVQLLPQYREEVRTSWLITKLREALRLHKEAYSAQVDYEFHRWLEDRRARGAQLAAMSPQELAVYQQQVRLMAEASAQRQLQQTMGKPAGALPGQSMQDVARGDDKITGTDQQAIATPASGIAPPVEDITPSNEPKISPTVGGTRELDHSSENIGKAILDSVITSRLSTLIVGGTGAGKSVTQSYILTNILRRYSDAEVWVIAQKNDSFCGLDKKGRVVLFDSLDPAAALSVIDHVHSIYDKRRRLPEHSRWDLSPVRLILADWLSINQALDEAKNEEPVKSSKYLTKLSDIIYNGRELNVSLRVDLQSFNLAAIGLKADRNSRKNFNLIGLGNYSVDEFGGINESYGVLANMVGNKDMVPDEEERAALLVVFKSLKPISRANQRPIIFTTLEPARVALLPDLTAYKPGQQQLTKLDTVSPDYLETLLQLEFEIEPKTGDGATPPGGIERERTGESDAGGGRSDRPNEHPELEPSELPSELLNQPTDEDASLNTTQFYTPLKLNREQVLELINRLKPELNQTEIIERLWQCKKGGSAAWKQAYAQFKELMGE
ncbi:hypothetical protein Cylst_6494 (plasmid) [Cylindrospermum stagnale PCC 7417]|uniref:Uncharacterized protein n=1 Tax=Cylindrospermum stagnale PCC 7417 TaxID=56107 RepID=K9X6J2_9NOST|nr:hypothetical protein [Cylindrospermum stagnale]AFZ28275.1 hypothetical protein Cylst_6494 [Cylindrospermum stagnale PCC 7417]